MDLYNILPNPDKLDENDPDNMLSNLMSDYYSLGGINNMLDAAGSKSLSVFHCNVRSLPINLTTLHDMIQSFSSPLDILAVTETKLNENTVNNVEISGYSFYYVDSSTNAVV